MFGLPSLLGVLAGLAWTGPSLEDAPRIQTSPDVRLEHFVLELRDSSGGEPVASVREVGLVCLRRRKIHAEKGGREGMQLESECLFLRETEKGDAERVLHVERLSSEGSRLVWREWGPGRARSLTAEWTPDGQGLRMVESSRGGMPRETLSAGDGAMLPLYLLELARTGQATAGRYRRLDPLSREIEAVDLATTYREVEGVQRRIVELHREDRSLAGHFEFLGTELLAFQWQEGDLVARRVSEAEYEQRSRSATTAAAKDERP